MKDRIVLVTGANGGLGAHVTRAFLDVGATVVGTSRKIEYSEFGRGDFTTIEGDLLSLEGAKSVVHQVIERFGRLDVLVHTVGGFAGGQNVVDTSDATFQSMLNVNLNSVFHILRAAVPHLRQSPQGRMIAIGSRAAAEPGAGIGAYSASKAAMVSLIKTTANENKDVALTANAILPGTIDTAANRKAMPNADFSTWVQPANIASLVSWLAGDAGKEVTGAAIPVYGNG